MGCLTQQDAEKFGKKLLGDNDVEAVLHRLDRLTLDEARTTAAQTLEVVYGLVQNLKGVISGEGFLHRLSWALSNTYILRSTGFNRQHPGGPRSVFFKRGQASTMADSVLELMQQITSDMNKSRRRFLRIFIID